MRISDWSSDVCSSDLDTAVHGDAFAGQKRCAIAGEECDHACQFGGVAKALHRIGLAHPLHISLFWYACGDIAQPRHFVRSLLYLVDSAFVLVFFERALSPLLFFPSLLSFFFSPP